jgi:intein/homing endonuclease
MTYNKGLQKSNELSKEKCKERILLAYEEWLKTKSNMKKIAIKHKTSSTLLSNFIKSKGHSFTEFNNNVFNNIDTEEKAYWLGFIFADGYVSENRNALELSLKLSDIGHLQKFYSFINCEREVKHDSFRCRLSVSNKILINSLKNLGCVQKKSLIIKFPNINDDLIRHFIRGYFDGDGCITKKLKSSVKYDSLSICSGSKEFLISLITHFNNFTKSNCNQKGFKPKNLNIYLIAFSCSQFKNFLNWIYKDSKIYLDRKYNRFLNSIAV